MTEEKPERGISHTKFLLPVALAVMTGLVGAAGSTLYKHELAILANARHVERLKIKDYRQHRDSLRGRVIFLANAKDTLEAVIEIEPGVFGPNSALILKARRSQLETAQERLENYIEENKHGGRDD
jgi:hypothetical protein